METYFVTINIVKNFGWYPVIDKSRYINEVNIFRLVFCIFYNIFKIVYKSADIVLLFWDQLIISGIIVGIKNV